MRSSLVVGSSPTSSRRNGFAVAAGGAALGRVSKDEVTEQLRANRFVIGTMRG
jgi:hypothetical protein